MEKPRKKMSSKKQSFSVLQADQEFVKKILSRNSSAGNRSSNIPDSFRAPAEVPFKWESRPGEPKDPPKKIDLFRPPPPALDDTPPESPPVPRAAVGPAFSRIRVRRFLKKLINKGNIWGGYKKKVDLGLPRSDHHHQHDQRFTSSVGPSSSESSFDNNLGFSTASATSSSSPMSLSSKLQSFSWGCIKSES